jgi:hypothetical protein
MQGLARDTEGDGRLRAQRVSVACLVPVRKGRGLEGEKKDTEVGVRVARPLVPMRALTDHRLWARGKNICKEGGTGWKRESTSLRSNEGRAVGLG